MAAPVGRALAGCALIVFIGVTAVQAATGRIAFSGAVVEPTCTSEGEPIKVTTPAFAASASARHSCGRTTTDPGRSYSQQVTRLAPADLAHDRLLAYFASYAGAGDNDGANVKVVINTYD